VIVSPEAVSDVSAVMAPTAPVKVTAPVPAVSVNVCAPFTVEPAVMKLMFAPVPAEAVVVMIDGPVKVTGPVSSTAPFFVEILFAIEIEPTFIVIAPSGTVDPIAPDNVTFPVPDVNVNACAPATVPSIVEEKLMFAPPPAEVSITVLAAKMTGPIIITEPLVVVVILPPRVAAPV
jgi:hypothetical protein